MKVSYFSSGLVCMSLMRACATTLAGNWESTSVFDTPEVAFDSYVS